MAFGFPARFAASRTFYLGEDELAAAVKSALEYLGWSYRVPAGGEFLASGPFSGGTWGEEFRVRILPGGAVEAESKCVTVRMPQVFDFGRNRQNVERFFSLVERGVGQGVYLRPVTATAPGQAEQSGQAAPKSRRAGAVLGGCLIAAIVILALAYFIPAAVGALTGQLYLPGGRRAETIHGAWARIISVIILMIYAWVVVSVLRSR